MKVSILTRHGDTSRVKFNPLVHFHPIDDLNEEMEANQPTNN